MSRSSRWVACAAASAICMASALSAVAQPSQASAAEKASAEALFDEALRLMHAGKFAEACPKFEVSQRIEAAVGTMLYLAECYEEIGRTASSWATFREAASLAEAAGQTDRMKTARSRAARLEPDLAWLTIVVSKEARAIAGLQLRRAQTAVQADLSGVAVPVDPGEVVVEASAPGYAPFSTTVTVPVRGRISVPIAALTPLPTTAAPPASAEPAAAATPASAPLAAVPGPAPASAPPPAEGQRSVLPYVFGGVGIVGIGVGSIFGLKAISKAGDARDACPGGKCGAASDVTLADDARSAAKVSNLAFVVGGAALAAGVVLFFTLPKKAEVGLVPQIRPEQRRPLSAGGALVMRRLSPSVFTVLSALGFAFACQSIADIPDVSFDDFCSTYCDAVEASCPSTLAQYETRAQCLKACTLIDAATNFSRDPIGNTMGCRLEQARQAKALSGLSEKAPACAAAGPGGGTLCTIHDQTPDCEGYCTLYTQACAGEFQKSVVSQKDAVGTRARLHHQVCCRAAFPRRRLQLAARQGVGRHAGLPPLLRQRRARECGREL
ncbi:MAG: hypothetical protein QM756_41220 [Polyangiaceae bacterium]